MQKIIYYNSISWDTHPFKCESCGKIFTQAGDLRKHFKAIHEGLKDFKCDSCEKYFTQSQYLMIHMNIIHEGHRYHNEKDEIMDNVINEVTKNIESKITTNISKVVSARMELRKFRLELVQLLDCKIN